MHDNLGLALATHVARQCGLPLVVVTVIDRDTYNDVCSLQRGERGGGGGSSSGSCGSASKSGSRGRYFMSWHVHHSDIVATTTL